MTLEKANALRQGMVVSLLADSDRWVLWFPVFLGLGVGSYFLLSSEPPLWLGAVSATVAVAAAWIGRRRTWLLAFAIGLAAIAFGFAVAQIRTAWVSAPVLDVRLGPVTVSGRAVLVTATETGRRIALDRPHISGLGPERTPERIRVTIGAREPPILPGDWLQVRAILSPPPGPSMPGAFDFQRQSYFEGLGAVGFATGRPALLPAATKASDDIGDWRLAIERLRHSIAERTFSVLPGANGAVVAALLTGDRSPISKQVLDDFRDSGLAHLLAISGLNIGLVAGILMVAVRSLLALVPRLALHYPIKKWAAVVAVSGAFFYTLLAGATVPTIRSFLMLALILVGVLLDRRGISMRVVAWAAVVILLFSPESLFGASFQMSFAAVVALIATYEVTAGYFRAASQGANGPFRRIAVYMAGVVLTTLVGSAASAPFAIFHFNSVANYGLLANLVAVPLTALWIMPCGVVAMLLMPFGWESLGLIPMGWGNGVILDVASEVASWPGAVTLLPAMPVWAILAVSLGGLWLCLWRQSWRWLGVGAMAAGITAIAFVKPPDILIDGRGRLMATRMPDGLMAISTATGARFEREAWLRRTGQEDEPPLWSTAARATADPLAQTLSCDPQGCLYRAGGSTVALVSHPAAVAEECWAADVLISTVPVRGRCPTPKLVIDRFDLWRDGAHALWLEDGQVRVESANGVRGHRPWVLRPRGRVPEDDR